MIGTHTQSHNAQNDDGISFIFKFSFCAILIDTFIYFFVIFAIIIAILFVMIVFI